MDTQRTGGPAHRERGVSGKRTWAPLGAIGRTADSLTSTYRSFRFRASKHKGGEKISKESPKKGASF